MKNISIKLVIFLLFLLSGISGLIYEVVWTRLLTLTFGNTVYAVSAVLSAFMAGLALGSFLIGRYSDKIKKPLKLYAALEGGIVVTALLIPVSFKVITPLYVSIYGMFGDSTVLMTAVRFIMSFLIILIPTTLMGGTLPVLSRVIVGGKKTIGFNLAFLYAINTLGALVGCAAAGFYLIPNMGIMHSVYTGVFFNLIACLTAFALKEPSLEDNVESDCQEEGSGKKKTNLKVVVLMFGLSGLAALGLEVIWTRVFLLIYGSTTYSFTIMLSTFLLGIGVGSLILGLFVDRIKNLCSLFASLEAVIALYTLGTLYFADSLPYAFLLFFRKNGSSWETLLTGKVLISFAILFIPAMLFGATLPVVGKLYALEIKNLGRKVGDIYALNTLGAILGSIIAGFILLPLLGMQYSLVVLASFLLISSLIITSVDFSKPVKTRAVKAAVLTVLFLVASFMMPSWDKKLLASGVYFHPTNYVKPNGDIIFDEQMNNTELLLFLEGLTETATITRHDGLMFFYVDGKVEASSLLEDMRLQRMMGHLPLLLHPDPKSALNIGLGAGVSLGACGQWPLEVLNCAELERGITKVATIFKDYNHDIINHPDLEIIFGDGRNYLLLTDRKYDVITSDPFEPLVGGAANLYTLEHFQLASKCLTKNGIMCQYLPLYQLSEVDFKMIANTFHEVFPYTSVWYSGVDALLIGSYEKIDIDFDTLKKKMEYGPVKKSLAEIGITSPYQFLSTFVLNIEDTPEYVKGIGLNTDNHPYIEFSAPRSHFDGTIAVNLREMLKDHVGFYPHLKGMNTEREAELERAVEAQKLFMNGVMSFLEMKAPKTTRSFLGALSYLPEDVFIRERVGNTVRSYNQYYADFNALETADEFLWWLPQEVFNHDKEHIAGQIAKLENSTDRKDRFFLALAYGESGELEKAKEILLDLKKKSPSFYRSSVSLGQIYILQGNYDEADKMFDSVMQSAVPVFVKDYVSSLLKISAIERKISSNELTPALMLERVGVYLQQNFVMYAMGILEKYCADYPDIVPLRENLASIYMKSELYGYAERVYNEIIEVNPENGPAHFYLMDIYLRHNMLDKAEEKFNILIKIDSQNASVWYNGARLKVLQGNDDDATWALKKAVTIQGPDLLSFALQDPIFAGSKVLMQVTSEFKPQGGK